MDNLRIHTEEEELFNDSRKLQNFNKAINSGFRGNIDELYLNYLHKHMEIDNIRDLNTLKQFVEYLKENA
jgi:hypothetical protein